MIWHLGAGWLLMAVASVGVMAFFFGSALDAVMMDDGFGPVGNMVLFTLGFFGAVYMANIYGIPLHDMKRASATGLGGAFSLIAVLAIFKAGIARLPR